VPNLQLTLSNQLSKGATKTALTMNELITTMKSAGMSNVAIRQTLLNDLNTGGQLFGAFRNNLKNTIKNGIEISSNDSANKEFTNAGIQEFRWVSIGDNSVCPDCAGRSGEIGTLEYHETLGLPASGFSVCQGNCRCKLVPIDYKGEDLDKPLIRKPKKQKQKLATTDFKMAGKHVSKKDSIERVRANATQGIPYAVSKEVHRFRGTDKVLKKDNPFEFSKRLSTQQNNRLNELFAESFSLSDKLGIPRLRGTSGVGRGSRFLAAMGDGILHINANKWSGPLRQQTFDKWESQIKNKKFVNTTSAYIHNSKNKVAANEKMAFWHEYAHHIHQQKGVKNLTDYKGEKGQARYHNTPLEKKINKLYDKLKNKSLKDAEFRYKNYPSTYAMENSKEWFAENYTMYKNGFKK